MIMNSDLLTRFKRVSTRQTLRLTHYGRKTGRQYEVKIWFVLDHEHLYISTANVNRQWVRNVQRTPSVKLKVGDEQFEGPARFLTERSEHERAMTAIRRKYWIFLPIFALGRALSSIGLMRDRTGSFEVILRQ